VASVAAASANATPFSVRHPERVKKLVLSNAVCFDSWPIPEFKPLQEPGAEDKMLGLSAAPYGLNSAEQIAGSKNQIAH